MAISACAQTSQNVSPDPTAAAEPRKIPETFTTTENSYAVGGAFNSHPSLSEQFNETLPSWLRFSGELRERFEGYSGGGFKPNSTDDYDLHRLRLGILISPTSWLRVYAETQDARVWGKSPAIPPYQNTWDVRQAYLELGETEGDGISVRAGRQELNFGNGRLIGRSWWTNVSRSFDGVRVTLRERNVRIDAFASSVVIVRDGVIDHHNQGNDLHGIYGQIKNPVPNSMLEPYGFWHLQSGVATKPGTLGHLDQFTYGFRFLGALPGNFDYRTEMAIQRGKLGVSHIRSWMGHWTGGYTFAEVVSKPRLFVDYNYGSGDKNPRDTTAYNTFDPIYPTTHDKLGLADQFGWRNIQDLRFGSEFRLRKKFTLGSSAHDFWLANAHDALYPTRGSVIARDKTGRSGTHVGEELDVQAIYKPNAQTQIGAGYGHIFTGQFLNRTTKGKDYNAPYMLIDYVF